jgi:hypothetical protein
MLHFDVNKKSKRKRMDISRPLESDSYTFLHSETSPEQTSERLVPSLDSKSSRNSITENNISSEIRRARQCSYSSGESTCLELPKADKLPTQSELDIAGDIPIIDADGVSRPFKSLYSGETAIGEQQMVIFVRHFFCLVS